MRAGRRRTVRAAALVLGIGLGLALPGIVASIELEPDEPPIVRPLGPTPSTVTITIHDGNHATVTSIPAGFKVHPRVVVSGTGARDPSGQLTVRSYPTANCAGTSDLVTLQNLFAGVADVTSLARSLPAPGAVSFKVEYPGDVTYAASTACKTVTITKAIPTMLTEVHDAGHAQVTSVFVGTSGHVFVWVQGNGASPTGTVTFNRYTTSDCSGTPVLLPSRTLDDEGAEGPPVTSAVATTLYVRPRYAGDAVYEALTGPCRAIAFVKADPDIAFAVHNASHQVVTGSGGVLIGTAAHPAIVVSGPLGTPAGEVRVVEYPNETCTTGSTLPTARTITLSGGASDSTANGVTKSKPAVFSWRATYQGSDSYNKVTSGCRVVRWKAPVTFSSAVHAPDHERIGSVEVGTEVHPTVLVLGDFGTPTGKAVPQSFLGTGCTLSANEGSALDLSNGGAHFTGFTRSLDTAGSMSFRLLYNGDATYLPGQGNCVAVTVVRATPAVQVQVHDADHGTVTGVDVGETVHPRIVFTGNGVEPGGTVQAHFFTNGTCAGTTTATSAKAALSDGVAHLTGFSQTPATPGAYSFRGTYNADSSYGPATSPCVAFSILAPGATPPPPTPTPVPTPTAGPGATAGPGPTSGPGATPPGQTLPPGQTVAPGQTLAPAPSLAPGQTLGPGQSIAPGQTMDLGQTSGASESAAPGASVPVGASPPSATGGPNATAGQGPAGSGNGIGGGDLGLLALLIAVVAIGLGSVAIARRRRRAS